MYNAFWNRVSDFLKASFFGRLFFKIVFALSEAFKNSLLYSFFTNKNMSDYASSSKICMCLQNALFKGKLSKIIKQSFFVRFVCELWQKTASAPVRVLSFYIIPCSLLFFINCFGNVLKMTVFAALLVIAVVLARFDITIGCLLNSSKVFGLLFDFYNIKTDFDKSDKPYLLYTLAVIFGIVSGGLSFVLSNSLAYLVSLLFILLPILLSSPLLLLSVTVLGSITLSTFPAFVLSILTFIVVLCRLFYGLEKIPALRPVSVFVSLYWVLTLYYVFNGSGGNDGVLAGVIQLVMLLFFFSVIVVINKKELFVKFCHSISVFTIVTSLIGLYQFMFNKGGTGWSDSTVYVGGLSRISSTFLNPNVYGEFLIMVICITIISILVSKSKLSKLFFAGCLALQLVNLALTYSRGCYIAVAFAAFIIVWCCDKRLLSALVLAVPVLPYILPQNILTRILSVGSYLKDTSVSYRFSIWIASLKIIKNHWFIGAGVGAAAFNSFYQHYMMYGVVAQHSHNWFMQIAIELSVVAVFLLVLIIVFVLKDVCYTIKHSGTNQSKFLIIPLVAAVFGIIFEGFVDHIFYNNIIYLMFWMLLALIVCALNIFDNNKKEIQYEKLQTL